MKTETATYTKTHFGKVLESSLLEPVVIEKSGRNVAVMVSFDEFQRLCALEDKHWASQAHKAQKAGFIGNKASAKLIDDLLNAED
jgi:PHD/YefM family antitoxin component YafN of YafNO toxin-antitoxin module